MPLLCQSTTNSLMRLSHSWLSSISLHLKRAIRSQLACVFITGSVITHTLIGIGIISAPASVAYAQSEPHSAVLLKNGRVLTGLVSDEGNGYLIRMGENSSIRFKKEEVERVGEDLKKLYDYKRSKITRRSAGDHYQLCRWCMLNGLLDESVEQYQLVAKLAGDHPRVEQLATELKHRILAEPDFRKHVGLPPIDDSNAAPSLSSLKIVSSNAATNTLIPDTVAAASYQTEAIYGPPKPNSLNSPQPQSSDTTPAHDFRVQANSIVALQFSQHIQPILVNRCSQAACHGSRTASKYQILESYGQAFAGTSESNLRNTLSQVSRSGAVQSPLLGFATKRHGLQRDPAIRPTESLLIEKLSNWIRLAQTQLNTPVQNALATQTNTGALGQSVVQATATNPWQQKFVPYQPVAEFVPLSPGTADVQVTPGTKTPPMRTEFPAGESAPSTSELDALDAEIRELERQGLLPGPISAENAVSTEAARGNGSPPIPPPAAGSSPDPFDPHEFNRRVSKSEGSEPGANSPE